MKQFLLLISFVMLTILGFSQYNPFVNLNGIDELQHPNEVFLIDFDLDGDKDIVCLTSLEIGWFENLGFNFYSEMQFLANGENDMEILDVDRDGDLDIVFIARPFSHVYVIHNLGDESFSDPVVVEGGAGLFKMEFADLDLDGDLDMVGVQSTRVEWFEYNEFNDLVETHTIMNCLDAHGVSDLIVHDMDGDRDVDIIWCSNIGTGNFYFIENLGGGVFADPDTLNTEISNFSNLAIADYDEDGQFDIVSASTEIEFGRTYGFINYYEKIGDSFASAVLVSDNLLGDVRVFSNDLDLDGNIDILSTSTSDSKLAIYKGNGDNSFEDQFVITTSLRGPKGIAIGDLNDDGDNDICIGSSTRNIGYLSNTVFSSIYFKGQLYMDFNENGVHDFGEVGLSSAVIKSTPSEVASVTGRDGRYAVDVDGLPNGEYEIFPFLPGWHITSENPTHNITVSDTIDFLDTLNFGLMPDIRYDSISFDCEGFSRLRCSDVSRSWIVISNLGTTSPSGKIHLKLDDSLTFVSSSLEPDSVIGQNVYWTYNDLDYLEIKSFDCNVLAPDEIGDTLESILYGSIVVDGEITLESEFDYEQVVICSYDPNDKTPNPKGDGVFGNIPMETEVIDYTIRFQNTGTDTAHLVIIRDQLDDDFDWMSFEPISSSHDLRINFNPDGKVAFIFEDIMLPDSNANVLESQGFVKYRIKVKPDLPVGTIFENTAGIYFDHNPVVLTNTTINTLYEKSLDLGTVVNKNETELSVYPNPTKGIVNIRLSGDQPNGYSVSLINIVGQEVYTKQSTNSNVLNIETVDFETGIYLLRVTYGEHHSKFITTKLIVE